jgi:hypothetical protein
MNSSKMDKNFSKKDFSKDSSKKDSSKKDSPKNVKNPLITVIDNGFEKISQDPNALINNKFIDFLSENSIMNDEIKGKISSNYEMKDNDDEFEILKKMKNEPIKKIIIIDLINTIDDSLLEALFKIPFIFIKDNFYGLSRDNKFMCIEFHKDDKTIYNTKICIKYFLHNLLPSKGFMDNIRDFNNVDDLKNLKGLIESTRTKLICDDFNQGNHKYSHAYICMVSYYKECQNENCKFGHVKPLIRKLTRKLIVNAMDAIHFEAKDKDSYLYVFDKFHDYLNKKK